MTPQLSNTERNKLWDMASSSTGFSSKFSDIMKAFEMAANKFGLTIKSSKKGTPEERYTLSTNHNNCDEVQDYITSLKVGVGIIGCKVTFAKRNCQ